jgi:hypothetical protein
MSDSRLQCVTISGRHCEETASRADGRLTDWLAVDKAALASKVSTPRGFSRGQMDER